MEMSVTRALAELKTLDARIKKAINETSYITMVTGKKIVPGFESNKEFEDTVKSKYQSVNDLIKRRNKIKSAIVKSNAVNTVQIGRKTYTVAEAIERKNSIEYERFLLQKLKSDYKIAVDKFELENENVKNRLDDLLGKTFGKDVKVTPEQYDVTAKPFLEQNAPKLVDPLDIKKEIDNLENEIDEFLMNCDFVLSEANSINKIQIED